VEDKSGARWDHPAFDGVIADGFVWGRGTMDDKGALVAMMAAVELLVADGFAPNRDIYFSFGHDEEIGGAEGASAVADHLSAQGVQLAWSLDEGSAVLRAIVPGLKRDVASINVAEKGYITVDITANGAGGHSSLPPRQTAVGELAEAIVALQAEPVPGGLTGASKEFFDALGPNFPLLQRVLFANQWLSRPVLEMALSGAPSTDAMLRTTMAPTMLEGSAKENVLPQEATATVNYRLHPRDSVEDIVALTQERVGDDLTVELRGGFQRGASAVSRSDNAAFAGLAKTFGQVFGDVIIVPGLTIAGTDTRHYSRVADDSYRINPFVMTGEDIPRLHGVNERLSLEDLERAAQFYTVLLRNTAQ
jgi:carboxypeptidase PM20D1